MTAPRLLTVAEAAERLHVCEDTVRNLVARRLITCVRVGYGGKKARIRFTEEDLEQYIARNRRVAPADEAPPSPRRIPRRAHVALDLPAAQRYV